MAAFARFFDALGFSHGELLNFSSLARDCGVDSKTVREYFQILEDTLLGNLIEPFARRRSRAVVTRAPKFYLFDVGVAGYLVGRRIERARGPDFGRALEHFVLMEVLAYRSYAEADFPIRYWRTKSGLEVDFVLGRNGETAIEVKGARVRTEDLKGLRAFVEEHEPENALVVCDEPHARRVGPVDVLPWRVFLGAALEWRMRVGTSPRSRGAAKLLCAPVPPVTRSALPRNQRRPADRANSKTASTSTRKPVRSGESAVSPGP